MNAQAINTREQFGAALRFHRAQRKMTPRDVADRTGASVQDVEGWETGRLLPNPNQWARLKGMVSHALNQLSPTYHALRDAGDPPKPAPEQRINSIAPKLEVALAPKPEPPKLVVVPPAPVEAAKPVERKTARTRMAKKRPGSLNPAAVAGRRAFIADYYRANPSASIQSGMDALAEKFGMSVPFKTARDIREEVTRGALPPTQAPPVKAAPPRPAPSQPGDIQAAVDLILAAVPNLRSLTISVDDAGVASVDYKVREVVVRETGGTLTVRRADS